MEPMHSPHADILLNLLYNKNLDDVIDSLAHEMAHIVLGDDGHGPEFDLHWTKLRRSIIREYHRVDKFSK